MCVMIASLRSIIKFIIVIHFRAAPH
jgi:hypothetical protein